MILHQPIIEHCPFMLPLFPEKEDAELWAEEYRDAEYTSSRIVYDTVKMSKRKYEALPEWEEWKQ